MEVRLYAVKSGNEIYYVVAEDYAQATTKYMMEMSDRGKDRVEPEKVTIAADASHLILHLSVFQ